MRKILAYYLAIGFILNFIWEISQSGLYEPHFQGTLDFILVRLRATLGDVAILLAIYFIAILAYRDKKLAVKEKTSPYAFAAFLGFIFSVGIERYALSTGRWAYNSLMPIIPYINAGLAPILQLMTIAPLSLFFAKIFFSKKCITNKG